MSEVTAQVEAPASENEVSTTLPANDGTTAVSVPTPVAQGPKVQYEKEGAFNLPLIMLDLEWIDNYRKSIADAELIPLMKSIDEATKKNQLGVKQPPLGAWNEHFNMVYVVAGACRIECCHQIALTELVNKYNKAFGYKTGDPGYVSRNGSSPDNQSRSPAERIKARQVIREQGGEWQVEYDRALASYNLILNLRDYGDITTPEAKQLAQLDNMDENMNRTDPTLADKLKRIELMASSGLKPKTIADRLGLTEGQVSQLRKVNATPTFLRELFASDRMEELKLSPADLAKERETMEVCVLEFESRIRENKNDRTIGLSLAREFAGAIQHKNDNLSVKQICKLLRQLVRVTDDGKTTNQSPPEISSFKKMIEDARRITKAGDVEPTAPLPPGVTAGTVAIAPPKIATPETTVASNMPKPDMSVAALATEQDARAKAEQVASAASAPSVNTKDGDTEAAIKAANLRAANADVPVDFEGEEEALGAEDLDAMEATDVDLDALAADDDSDVAAAITSGAKVNKPQAEDGQKTMKTTDATLSKYKPLPPEQLEKFSMIHLNSTVDPASTLVDSANYAFAAVELLNAIGMSNESKKINAAYVPFSEGINAYINAMENFVNEKATAGERDRIMAFKPTFEIPNLG